MTRPLLLDLFCGAGGAAMGYHRAGFDVVGVDIEPQPHYPFEFHQTDAMQWLAQWGWDRPRPWAAIHASPPCQAYSQAQRLQGNDHPRLLADVRLMLYRTGLPYIIENVPGAMNDMEYPVMVCGRGLGLKVKRHRLFEHSTHLMLMGVPCTGHDDYITVFGHSVERRGGKRIPLKTQYGREAMGIDWMNRDELSEAIPPAYTEFIGAQLLEHLERGA